MIITDHPFLHCNFMFSQLNVSQNNIILRLKDTIRSCMSGLLIPLNAKYHKVAHATSGLYKCFHN